MNKKLWIAALLVTVMAVAAGCGNKPTAAPPQTQGAGSEDTVTEVQGETEITEPTTVEPDETTSTTTLDTTTSESEGTNSSGVQARARRTQVRRMLRKRQRRRLSTYSSQTQRS
ncbi:hypothetical protein [Paenibacillus sp. DCT19]|uniref:hypothetical protein n=1 Tax=Paenibacillus sp. DCT19 TaxID=2211212 RepID=UPI0020C55BC7|nr:hypothetical protein [Paenibacillus sp. DCT19]